MTITRVLTTMLAGVLVLLGGASAVAQQAPTVTIPNAGVPEIMTIEGTFVRAAYNNEGYVILGYEASNRSVGEEWMLLDVGITLMARVPDFTMRRDAFSLTTPDGGTVPLPSIEEHRKGDSRAIQNRARVQRDSINYFPPNASRACAIVFFPDLTSRAMPRDDVELSSSRACLGRLFFRIPGGIAYGQHFLNVKFEKSVVRVPFRILTKDEEQLLNKNYKSIKKQVEDAFKPKK
jgi:hypothetical protein